MSEVIEENEDCLSIASSKHLEIFSPNISTDSTKIKRIQFSRSKSLETNGHRKSLQKTRSLDEDDGGSDDILVSRPPQYKVLADYSPPAAAPRELSLHQGETVTLLKIGCAGWWYIRLFYL